MWIFGKPNVQAYKRRGDVSRLMRCLEHRDLAVRRDAAVALHELSRWPEHRLGSKDAKVVASSVYDADDEVAVPLLRALQQSRGGFWSCSTLMDVLAKRRLANTELLLDTLIFLGYSVAPSESGETGRAEAEANGRRLAELDWTRYDPATQARYFQYTGDYDRLVALGAAASERVRQLLADRHERVTVVPVLGRLDPATDRRWASDLLVECLCAEPPSRPVAEALRQLRWWAATADEEVWEHVALDEWEKLVEMGGKAVPALCRLLLDEGERGTATQEKVATALGAIGDARAIPALIATWRKQFSAGLNHIDSALVEIGRDHLEHLLAVVRADPGSRVARVLGEIGDPRAIDTLVEALRKEPHPIWYVTRGLSSIEHPDRRKAIGPLIQFWKKAFSGRKDSFGWHHAAERVKPVRDALETITGRSFADVETGLDGEVEQWERWALGQAGPEGTGLGGAT
jgi:hypothetical protein